MTDSNYSQKKTELSSESLLKEGFFPLQQLAQKHGYAKDHLGRLARQGKVRAMRYGTKGEWHVNEDSLLEYRRELMERTAADTHLQKPLNKPDVAIVGNVLKQAEGSQIESRPAVVKAKPADVLAEEAEAGTDERLGIASETPPGIWKGVAALLLTAALVVVPVLAMSGHLPPRVEAELSKNITAGVQNALAAKASIFDNIAHAFGRMLALFTTPDEPETYLVLGSQETTSSLSLTATPQEDISNTSISEESNPSPTASTTVSEPTRISERVVITQTLGSAELQELQSALTDSRLRLDGFQYFIKTLQDQVGALQRIRPAAVLPMEYHGTNPSTAIGANTLTSEKLTVSGATTLASLTVSGALTAASGKIAGNFTIDGNITVGGSGLVGTQFTVLGSSSVQGRLELTKSPTIAHTGSWPNFSNLGESTFFIRADSPVADGNIIAYVSGNDAKFVVDAEGDVFARNLVLTGSTTQSNTTVAGDLNVEGNVRFGDAAGDQIKFVGTVLPNTLTSNIFTIQASPSWTGDWYFRALDSASSPLFTIASTGNAVVAGQLTVSGTASNSFAGSLDITKGLRAANFTQVGSGVSYFNGNVGVGTTGPSLGGDTKALTISGGGTLAVDDTTGTLELRGVRTSNGNFGNIRAYHGTTNVAIIGFIRDGANDAGAINFATQATGGSLANVMRITSGGNVGIGTTGPSTKLHIHDGNVTFSNPGVFHGIAGWAPNDVAVQIITGDTGGLDMRGFSDDAGKAGATIYGIVGVTDPTDTTPGIILIGARKGGITPTTLGDAETVFQLRNYLTNVMTVLGSGNVGIGTTGPGKALDVTGEIRSSSAVTVSSGGVTVTGNSTFNNNVFLASGYIENSGASGVSIGRLAFPSNAGIGLMGSTAAGTYIIQGSYNNDTVIAPTRDDSNNLGDVVIRGGGAERARFKAAGNVGIGTTAPTALTHIVGDTATLLNVASGSSSRFAVLENGNVGVGTTSPAGKLHVAAGFIHIDNGVGRLESKNAAGTLTRQIIQASSADSIDVGDSGAWTGGIRFYPGAAEAMRITSAGNVGIGTTAPGATLHVVNADTASNQDAFLINQQDINANEIGLLQWNGVSTHRFSATTSGGVSTGGSLLLFGGDGVTENMAFRANGVSYINSGNVGIGTTSPTALTHIVGDTTTLFNVASGSNSRFVVMESGNVGIGTTAPGGLLSFSAADSNTAKIQFQNSVDASPNGFISTSDTATGMAVYYGVNATVNAGGVFSVPDGAEGASVIEINDGGINFYTMAAGGVMNNSERLRIDPSGNIGIGGAAPTALTSLYSTATASFDITSQGQTDKRFTIRSNYQGSGASERLSILNGAGTELFTIASGGNVGIGTTSPTAALYVKKASALGTEVLTLRNPSTSIGSDAFIFYTSAAGSVDWYVGKNPGQLTTGETDSFQISTSKSEAGIKFVVENGGNVGIGTTGPDHKLEITGDTVISEASPYLGLRDTEAGHDNFRMRVDADKYHIATSPNADFSAGSDLLTIQQDGSVGIGTTGPSQLLEIFKVSAGAETTPLFLRNGHDQAGTATALAFGSHSSNTIVTGKISSIVNGPNDYHLAFSTYQSGVQERMRIGANGNIGIATSNPGAKLEVNGDAAVKLVNDVSNVAMCYEGAEIGIDAVRRIGDCATAVNADYAELYPVEEGIGFGEVVAIDPSGRRIPTYGTDESGRMSTSTVIGTIAQLTRSTEPYQPTIIGITSNNYSDFTSAGYNLPEGENKLPVALNGRVPTKVSLENGPIRAGDRLTASSTSGVAMKATEAGQTVGIALEPLDTIASGSYAKLLTFVNVGYWAPTASQVVMTSGGGNILAGIGATPETLLAEMAGALSQWLTDVLASGSIQLVKAVNGVFEKLTANEIVVGDFEANRANVQTLQAENIESRNGITVYDTATGARFCMGVTNGITVSTPGACAAGTPTPSPTPTQATGGSAGGEPSPSPEPTSAESSPTEAASPTPEPTAEPNPSPTPTPTPTPEPSPEPELWEDSAINE